MINQSKRLAAAYVRGCAQRGALQLPGELVKMPLDELDEGQLDALQAAGRAAGLKLYRFKKVEEPLPRVRKVLGFLRGVAPESLLDVGSGRGVFLFPFLQAFPWVETTAVDLLDHRVEFLRDLARGGCANLTVLQQDICSWDAPDKAFDVVTLLEVLEHIPDVERAVRMALRLARRYVVVTVPSKEDDNPEHIHLLTREMLTDIFTRAGCARLHFDGVPGHLFLMAQLGWGKEEKP